MKKIINFSKKIAFFILIFFLFAENTQNYSDNSHKIKKLKPEEKRFGLLKELYKAEGGTYEVMFVLLEDGTIYGLTTREEHMISISSGQLSSFLNEHGYSFENVVLLVHNHYFVPHFSIADLAFYRDIASMGFRGAFILYVQPHGQIVVSYWNDRKTTFEIEKKKGK